MARIDITKFSGVRPRTGPADLQVNEAQIAQDVKLQSGEIRAWRKPVLAYTPALSNLKSIYKMLGPNGASQWLEFQDDVDLVGSVVADITDFRVYYTAASYANVNGVGLGPRKTNWNLTTNTGIGVKPFPNSYLEMGVPAPAAAPAVAVVGGAAPTETRAYLYTYVSTFGSVQEESAPSPATVVTGNQNGTWNISGWSTAPHGAHWNITAINIYRTVTGSSAVVYQLVDQIALTAATGAVVSGSTSLVNSVVLSGTTYPDTVALLSLGQALPSLTWTPPPAGLTGIVELPNGIVAGFTANQVWFCEPYHPHAWPVNYVLTTEFPIVGLGVYGNTLLVCTTYLPYTMTGNHPASMTQERLTIPQPCVAKDSIAYDQFGVLYASPNGIVYVGPGVAEVVTIPLFTRDEWQQLVPSSIHSGGLYNNFYIALYTGVSSSGAVVLSRGDTPPLTFKTISAAEIFFERTTGNLYYLSNTDNNIYQFDADEVNNDPYQWKSKKFILPRPVSFGALKVQGDFSYIGNVAAYQSLVAQIIAQNNTRFAAGKLGGDLNGAALNTYELDGSALLPIPPIPATRNIQVIVYADEQQVFSTGITSAEPIRLPATGKNYMWEILITGNSPVRSVALASTIGELRQEQ